VSAFRRLAGCADEKIRLCDLQWVQVSSLEKRNERTDRVSFWMIGNSYVACGVAEKCANSLYSYQDLQNRLFTIFQFVFVARESTQISNIRLSLTCDSAGVIAQTQPKFIANRDVFESAFSHFYILWSA
jgi:hypothetical protein